MVLVSVCWHHWHYHRAQTHYCTCAHNLLSLPHKQRAHHQLWGELSSFVSFLKHEQSHTHTPTHTEYPDVGCEGFNTELTLCNLAIVILLMCFSVRLSCVCVCVDWLVEDTEVCTHVWSCFWSPDCAGLSVLESQGFYSCKQVRSSYSQGLNLLIYKHAEFSSGHVCKHDRSCSCTSVAIFW